jgi:hypothetical protein
MRAHHLAPREVKANVRRAPKRRSERTVSGVNGPPGLEVKLFADVFPVRLADARFGFPEADAVGNVVAGGRKRGGNHAHAGRERSRCERDHTTESRAFRRVCNVRRCRGASFCRCSLGAVAVVT